MLYKLKTVNGCDTNQAIDCMTYSELNMLVCRCINELRFFLCFRVKKFAIVNPSNSVDSYCRRHYREKRLTFVNNMQTILFFRQPFNIMRPSLNLQ